MNETGCQCPHGANDLLVRLTQDLADRAYLVGIDGLGGAGKSSVAQAVAETRADVSLIEGDDFYRPEEADWLALNDRAGYETYFDHRRLEREVLAPLRAGKIAEYQRYDWHHNALGERVTVRPTGIVVVEGVYMLRPRLRQYWDLKVYIDTPRELRLARQLARGNDEEHLRRWLAAEDYYERTERPADAADLVIFGC
jgi:uridine kinase